MKQIIHQFWIAGGIALCCLTATNPAKAQIASDGTLSTNVMSRDNLNFTITGGNPSGSSLFHSFSEFSVPTKGLAFFDNASGIQNIISRVTGGSISNIDGLIQANDSANLFLLNPSGIMFGPNASLDIGGSFVASTASSLNFADGTQFSATAPQTPPLLIVSVPIGLQFGTNPGEIINQSRTLDSSSGEPVGLQVPGKTLALVGGDVTLDGGRLTAAGGRIELGSVAGPSLVSLSPVDTGWVLGYAGVPTFENIQLSGAAEVNASGVGGGDIQVQGKGVTLIDGSRIEADTLGAEPGGSLSIIASESVKLSGFSADGDGSGLFARVREGATGNGGEIVVETGQLIVENRAQVSTATRGQGDSGNITLKTGQLTVREGGQIRTNTRSGGQAGDLAVTDSESVELIGGAEEDGQFQFSGLFSGVGRGGVGDGGNITIETGRLTIRDGARISTIVDTGSQRGNGGNVKINASESVELMGSRLQPPTAENQGGLVRSGIFTGVDNSVIDENGVVVTPTIGNGGDITIETRQLSVREGTINASTQSVGSGGTVTVRASESVELVGVSIGLDNELFSSGLFTGVLGRATGAGGDIAVETGRLVLQGGARVSTETSGEGDGGNITVTASSVELIGTSADSQLPSRLTASSTGSGAAGNLEVTADSIRLDQGSISSETTSGQGNIILRVQDLLVLRRGSNITTNAQGTATGGNITIGTPDDPLIALVALEDSDISANAEEAAGGQVTIDTQGDFRSPDSDITASSELGIDGLVEINTPDVEVQSSLTPPSANFVSPEQVVAGSCLARRNEKQGSFTVTGTGGLPRSPYEAISGQFVVAGVQPIQASGSVSSHAAVVESSPWKRGDPIQEAQGMVVTADGRTIVGTTPQLVALAKAQNLVCDSD